MAKKTTKKKTAPNGVTVTEIPSLETRITVLEQRIDRIVTALSQSKSVKGL